MIRLGTAGRTRKMALVEESPLRPVDPRVKLTLCLCASLAVMLPLERLAVVMLIYLGLLAWAKLLPAAIQQIWRLKWVLIILFVVDWLMIDLYLAMVIVLRLILLTGVFALFFSTTTIGELRLTLEWMRIPYRYAFSISLAFQSIGLLDDEWRNIRDAQRARGAYSLKWSGWRNLMAQVQDLISLTVPAIVLTTKRAWATTEAAYARGFDTPRRRPYRQLVMKPSDWMLLLAIVAVSLGLTLWR
jgi:energy-coupling factor transporter transmembrane protein EcfT